MSFGGVLDAAVAGTWRRDPPAALPGFGGLEPPDRLLRSASFEGLRRLAGRPLDRVEEIVTVEPCAPETRAAVHPLAELRFQEILWDRPALLLEWLGVAAAREQRVPHACLPDLLEYARAHPETHDLVVQVGGERLAWLSKLNTDWHFAARSDPEGRLMLGTRDERPVALKRIRRQNAARGRELLEDIWPSERGESRAALLEALEDGLTAADEPLLERAVRDARKEVRDTGLRLIRRIPHSRFGRRWTERARRLLVFKEVLPEVSALAYEPDPDWVSDGLDPRPPKGIGRTAWLLQQVLAFTPPSAWPRGSLVAIQESDWSRPLVSGLSQAAQAYADAEWCEDFLLAWAAGNEKLRVDPGGLLGALAPGRAEAVFGRLLDTGTGGLAALATSLTHAWSEDFSRLMVGRMPDLLDKSQYAAAPFLRDVPLRLDPRVVPDAARLLDRDIEPVWVHLALERLVQTLEFRRAMREELETSVSGR